MSAEPEPAPPPRRKAAIAGRILVVDDNETNRDLLSRRLIRQGHTTVMAVDGVEALEVLAREPIDMVLLDLMMPRLDGLGVLTAMQEHAELRNVPVVMISALTDVEQVAKCVEKGAADYLQKPFNPVLLRARVDACLERKALRDRERQAFHALRESQAELASELQEAAAYVSSLLPAPLQGAIATDWTYVPSARLGGDGFGYRDLDEQRFAVYLIDVSGHGVGAALLSVSVMNALGRGAFGPDAGSPARLLTVLNETFPMERNNNMYFTAWYGVYDRAASRLRFASGGHPPAVLVAPDGATTELKTRGVVIGGMPEAVFVEDECAVPQGSRLHVFSDGAYEVQDGAEQMAWEKFLDMLRDPGPAGGSHSARVYEKVHKVHGEGPLDDDFSLLTIAFGGTRG